MMIDLKQASKFLEILDEHAEFFTFQVFPDSESSSVRPEIIHSSLEQVSSKLEELNKLGAGIFVTINETDGNGRSLEHITRVRAYMADRDTEEFNPPTIEPTAIIKTGNGEHYYFILKEFSEKAKKSYRVRQEGIIEIMKTDPSIKDLPRVMRLPGFYHCKDMENPKLITVISGPNQYYTEKEIEDAFPLVANGLMTYVEPKASITRGILLPIVQEFLAVPWSKRANEQHLLITSISNMKKNNFTEVEATVLLEGKGGKLDANTKRQIKAVYRTSSYKVDPFLSLKKEPAEGERSYKDLLFMAELYKDINNTDELYLLDRENSRLERIKQANATLVLGRKEFTSRVQFCKVDYVPYSSEVTLPDSDGYPVLNSYIPPFWRKSTLESIELPVPYKTLFEHLFGMHRESYDYVLDWIAFSLRGKNIPILALVGTNRGIGKNILGNILSELHGPNNSEICKQSVISKEFNASVWGKTLIHMDEISITKDSDFEAIKAYTNSTINIEGKGKESKTATFYGNLYLTNNKLDCLSGVSAEDDRQFSIVCVTDKKLDVRAFRDLRPSETDISWLWKDKELLAQLASFLFNRDLSDYDYVTNYKSSHYYDVVKTSVPEWVKFLTEDVRSVHYNCAIKFTDLKTILNKHEGVRPGRSKIEAVCKEYSNVVSYRYIRAVPYVFFAKEEEGFKDFQKRVRDSLDSFSILELPNSLIG